MRRHAGPGRRLPPGRPGWGRLRRATTRWSSACRWRPAAGRPGGAPGRAGRPARAAARSPAGRSGPGGPGAARRRAAGVPGVRPPAPPRPGSWTGVARGGQPVPGRAAWLAGRWRRRASCRPRTVGPDRQGRGPAWRRHPSAAAPGRPASVGRRRSTGGSAPSRPQPGGPRPAPPRRHPSAASARLGPAPAAAGGRPGQRRACARPPAAPCRCAAPAPCAGVSGCGSGPAGRRASGPGRRRARAPGR